MYAQRQKNIQKFRYLNLEKGEFLSFFQELIKMAVEEPNHRSEIITTSGI